MKQRFSDLIEVAKVQRLTDLFYTATDIPASVIDLDGTVITGSGWQEICTNFHRVNAETRERCIESDTVIANEIGAGQKYTVYGCKNGLIDAATPITIEGEHVANFFTGQFLFHSPDKDFFQEQARRFGFDEAAYMEAVAKIPVIDEARLQPFLEVLFRIRRNAGRDGPQAPETDRGGSGAAGKRAALGHHSFERRGCGHRHRQGRQDHVHEYRCGRTDRLDPQPRLPRKRSPRCSTSSTNGPVRRLTIPSPRCSRKG